MPVPSAITDLSTTAGSNSPAGSEGPQEGDNYIRSLSSFIAILRDKLNGTSATGEINDATFSGTMAGQATWSSLQIFQAGISSTTGTFSGAVTASNLVGGEYTPTLTGVSNIAGTPSASVFRYKRFSGTIHVSGTVSVGVTTGAATLSALGISLPVASNFAVTGDCSGVGVRRSSAAYESGVVVADSVNNRASFEWRATSTSASEATVEFSYSVI